MPQAKTLTPAEIEKMLMHIASKPNAVRNRVMFLLTVWAGFRVSEVAGLKINDVRNADGSIRAEIYLSADRVKHGHAGVVYLNERLQRELASYVASRNWQDDEQALFCTMANPRKGFSANTMTQHFHYLYKRAGIAGGSSHSGRRTFITTLANKGVSVRLLASLCRHVSIATTQNYIDVNDDMKRAAIELIG
jgi:integrase/recombinase XerD